MTLGIPSDTLKKAFGIKNLPKNYVMTMPIRGLTQKPEIVTGPAVAKIAALIAASQTKFSESSSQTQRGKRDSASPTTLALGTMNLAVAAIFQNEARFLKEWIDFHRIVGVEHFYLFDHLSQDNPRKVLEPYIDIGLVQLTSWPIQYTNVYEWTELQCLAYERALHWARGKTK